MRPITLLPLAALLLLAADSYHLAKKFPLSGDGGWDYLTVDSAARRLYVSHATQTHIVNLDTGAELATIPGKGVHGVALANEFNRGFITNGTADTVTIFDLKTNKEIATVPTAKKPDAIYYDTASKRIFSNNNAAASTTIIDAATGKALTTLDLGGDPEASTGDGKGLVFTNLESTNEIVKIDSRAMKVLARYKLDPCATPTALVIDTTHQRLFTGCRSGIMAVLDAANGKIVFQAPIGKGVDAAAFDPKTRNVYFSNGDGTVNVFHQDSADKYTALETINTQRGAKTMAHDSKSGNLYFSVADYLPADPSKKGTAIKPGTFNILVFANH